jgi:uncharacterized membrane protein
MTKKHRNAHTNIERDQEEAIQILEKLPPEKIQLLLKKTYSGPVMPPEYAEHYEQIVSGSAREILDMAIKEQAHRFTIENKALDAQIEENKAEIKIRIFNSKIAAIIIVMFLLFALLVTHMGHENLGIAIVSMIGIIKIFDIIRK